MLEMGIGFLFGMTSGYHLQLSVDLCGTLLEKHYFSSSDNFYKEVLANSDDFFCDKHSSCS